MKQQKGITLVALVITIIILLILAGVTITTLFGENGIIKVAHEATKKYQNAQNSEMNIFEDTQEIINSALGIEEPTKYILKWNIGDAGYGNLPTSNAQAYIVEDEENEGDYKLLLVGSGKIADAYYWKIDGVSTIWVNTPADAYEKVERIREYQRKIKKAIISPKITALNTWTFSHCTELSNIEIPTNLKEFGTWTFNDTKWLEDRRKENPVVVVNNIIVDVETCFGNVIIPENVEKLNERLFSENSKITGITIPNSVKTIETSAFYECKNLQTVDMGNGVENIDGYVFKNCTKLTTVKFSSKLKNIGDQAFEGCYTLENIDLPEGLETIGQYAFADNYSITASKIVIPSTVKVIGDYKYPAGVFYNCGKDDNTFVEFEVAQGNKYYKTEDGILYTIDGSTLVAIPKGKTFTNNTYIMPDTVKNLGELSFCLNKNIKTTIISDNLIINDDRTDEEYKAGFRNSTNSLANAIGPFCKIEAYDVKETNKNYTSGIKLLKITGETSDYANQGFILTADGKELVAISPKCNWRWQMLPSVTTKIRKNAFYILRSGSDFVMKDGMYSGVHFRINKDTTDIDEEQLRYINWLAKNTSDRTAMTLEIQGGTNTKYTIVDNQYVEKTSE